MSTRGARAEVASSAPFGTSYNVTTPGRLIAGRQLENSVGGLSAQDHVERSLDQNHRTLPPRDSENSFAGSRYSALPPIPSKVPGHAAAVASEEMQNQVSNVAKRRNQRPPSNTSETDGSVFSAARSYAAKSILAQLKQCSLAALKDLESRIRRLQHDRRDCVEVDDVLRTCRQSSIRLSAAHFIDLLKQLDQYGNGSVPSMKLIEIFQRAAKEKDDGSNLGQNSEQPSNVLQYQEENPPFAHIGTDRKWRNVEETLIKKPNSHRVGEYTAKDEEHNDIQLPPAQTQDHHERERYGRGWVQTQDMKSALSSSPHRIINKSSFQPNHQQSQQIQYMTHVSVESPLRGSMLQQIALLQSNRIALERQRQAIEGMMRNQSKQTYFPQEGY